MQADSSARTNDFPRPKDIRAIAKEIAGNWRRSVPWPTLSPGTPENFLARCKRVGGHDAIWQRRHHHLLEPVMYDHFDGLLTDEWLTTAIRNVENGHEAHSIRHRRSGS